jgi:ABC-type transporter Mla maintaining outer membrane lipid asymmetry ATPase subunit MlaF
VEPWTIGEYGHHPQNQMIEPMESTLVKASALDLHFGRRAVLSGIDLTVAPGEIHGILGPSGCGKSVLLRVLAGDLEPSSGALSADRAVLVADEQGASLALARALTGSPTVLLIDEPACGYDPVTLAAVRELAQRHARRGGAAVWATRRLDALHGVAASLTLLAGGRTRYAGSVEALVLRSLAAPADEMPQPFGRAA